MTTTRTPAGGWRKSSYSGESNCVEVRAGFIGDEPGAVIRDSKDPDGPRLCFTADEWTAFLAGVRAGEFNDLL